MLQGWCWCLRTSGDQALVESREVPQTKVMERGEGGFFSLGFFPIHPLLVELVKIFKEQLLPSLWKHWLL